MRNVLDKNCRKHF